MNKQLQHIATALLLLVLLGAGKAWGQTCTALQDGLWNNATTWSCGVVPSQWNEVIIPSGITIRVNGDLTAGDHSGNLTIDGNLIVSGTMSRDGSNPFIVGTTGTLTTTGSLDIANLEVQAGGVVRIGGSYIHDAALTLNGLMVVESDMNSANGTQMTIGSATNSNAILVVKGKAVDNSIYNIWGKVYISGNLNKNSGGTLTLETTGFIAVGGNYNIQGTTTSVGGRMTVLGSFTSNNNVPVMDSGLLTVLGSYSVPPWEENTCTSCNVLTPTCCTDPDMSGVLLPGDPIFTTTEGIHALFWEDFTDNAGATSSTSPLYSIWEIVNTTVASVTTESGSLKLVASFTNTRPNNFSLFETGVINIGCYTNLNISAYVGGTKKTNANLQYQLLVGNAWQPWVTITEDPTVTDLFKTSITSSASSIRLRLNANSVTTGTITLDNIVVAGTRGLGPLLPTVEMDPAYEQFAVCGGQTTAYKLTQDYTEYTWSVTGANTITDATTATPTVTWVAGSIPATLTVVVKNACGRMASESWDITLDANFKISLLGHEDPQCAGDSNGSIRVDGACGTNNYNFSISPDPQNVVSNATGLFENLPSGTYTVTATDLGNGNITSSLQVTLASPSAIVIDQLNTSVTISCDPEFGCSGILDFKVSGGVGQLMPSLSGIEEGSVTALEIDPVVEWKITSDFSQNDYPLIVKVEKSQFPEVYSDFSDVRFFQDDKMTQPLNYWIDPDLLVSDTEAVFYVSADVANGASIYMYYGDATAFPPTSNISAVLKSGGMAFEYWSNATWAGSPVDRCEDQGSKINYPATTSFSTCPVSILNSNQSMKWKGWYPIPPIASNGKLNLKAVIGNNSTVQLFIGNASSGFGLKYLDAASFANSVQYVEIWFSNPSGNGNSIDVGFSRNEGGGITGGDIYFNPSLGMYREGRTPEPTVEPTISARFTGLCAGIYSLTVTDVATGCTAVKDNIEIEVSGEAVTWGELPGDYNAVRGAASYVGGQTLFYDNFAKVPPFDDVIWKDISGSYTSERYKLKYLGGGTGQIELTTSTKGFKDIGIEFTAHQSLGGEAGWTSDDYLRIEYWDPTGAGSWKLLLTDPVTWNGNSSSELVLPYNGNALGGTFSHTFATGSVAEDLESFRLRFTMVTSSTDHQFYFDEIRITGGTDFTVPVSTSGIPNVLVAGIDCDIEPYYVDQVTNDEDCGGGIQILRTWNAVDDCGTQPPAPYIQNITLYDPDFAPAFATVSGPPASLSFCNNLVENLTLPTAAASTCEPYKIYWTIDGGTNMNLVYESDKPSGAITPNVTFPANATTTFSWILVDQILATAQKDYSVTVGPEITATFSYNPSFLAPEVGPNICEGDGVTVTVNAQGGSGTFTRYDFTTTSGSASLPNDADGVWPSVTTFQNNDRVIVEITDSGGCSTSDRAAPNNGPITAPEVFTVHEGITTNPIQPAP